MSEQKVILKTEHLVRWFGALKATNDVSLDIYDGEVHAIIGPNGAGKSTLMDEIVNRTSPNEGKVFQRDRKLPKSRPMRSPTWVYGEMLADQQAVASLTCFENIQIALLEGLRVYDFVPKRADYLKDEVMQVLDIVGMQHNAYETAALLSYGDQRRLEIAITLAMEPKLLMLDEPTAGVARAEGYEIMKMIRKLGQERHITVVFIEHDMEIVFNYSDRISVLDHGTLIATDTPENIRQNDFVQQAYFGGGTQ